jgi:hypothetical protein
VLPLYEGLRWRDLGTVLDGVAEVRKPGEGGAFDDGFGESAHIAKLLLRWLPYTSESYTALPPPFLLGVSSDLFSKTSAKIMREGGTQLRDLALPGSGNRPAETTASSAERPPLELKRNPRDRGALGIRGW